MRGVLNWLEARLLDRREVAGCMLFAALSLPMLILIWLMQDYALRHAEVTDLYQAPVLEAAQWVLGTLIVWLAAVAAYGWRFRHVKRAPPGLLTWTVTPTLVVFVLLSVAYGLKDSPMCMVLIEEIIIARALFSLRAVTPTLVLGGALMLGSEVLLSLGWMAYAPMLTHPLFNGYPLHWWWALMPRVVFQASILPCSVMLFFFFNTLHRQRQELEGLVRTDALTGLANRREFMAQLAIESHRQLRDARPFCVVLCDIDHFKKVNDTWGHPVGDEVLAQLGLILQSMTRDQIDVAARLGGEEFGLILPDTDLAGAQRVAQKIAETLRATLFYGDGVPFLVTQSVGIAQVVNGQSDQALHVADQNLYTAKRSGRDQIVTAQAPPLAEPDQGVPLAT
jgi:diguanylate cyclase (GGDEF)-like protein